MRGRHAGCELGSLLRSQVFLECLIGDLGSGLFFCRFLGAGSYGRPFDDSAGGGVVPMQMDFAADELAGSGIFTHVEGEENALVGDAKATAGASASGLKLRASLAKWLRRRPTRAGDGR